MEICRPDMNGIRCLGVKEGEAQFVSISTFLMQKLYGTGAYAAGILKSMDSIFRGSSGGEFGFQTIPLTSAQRISYRPGV